MPKLSVPDRRARRWCVMDLVTDAESGRLLEPKIWSNIGKGTLTFSLVYLTLHSDLTEWFLLVYGGVVIGHESISRFMRQKENVAVPAQPARK